MGIITLGGSTWGWAPTIRFWMAADAHPMFQKYLLELLYDTISTNLGDYGVQVRSSVTL